MVVVIEADILLSARLKIDGRKADLIFFTLTGALTCHRKFGKYQILFGCI